jgi:hypothetical protein
MLLFLITYCMFVVLGILSVLVLNMHSNMPEVVMCLPGVRTLTRGTVPILFL